MRKRFVSVDRATPQMFPASIDDYLPEDHLARFMVAPTKEGSAFVPLLGVELDDILCLKHRSFTSPSEGVARRG